MMLRVTNYILHFCFFCFNISLIPLSPWPAKMILLTQHNQSDRSYYSVVQMDLRCENGKMLHSLYFPEVPVQSMYSYDCGDRDWENLDFQSHRGVSFCHR